MSEFRLTLINAVASRSFAGSLWLLLGMALCVPSGALAEPRGLCAELTLNTTLRHAETDDWRTRDCYRVTVPSRGVLVLDVSAPWTPDPEPHLVFLGPDSAGGSGYRLVRTTSRGVMVAVKTPGIFFLAIVSEDLRDPLGAYKLRTAFVPGEATWDVAKDVNEDDCDILEVGSGGSLVEICDTSGLATGDDRYRLGHRFAPCELGEVDDHGDTPFCATPVAWSGSVAGEISNAAGDDEDFFVFVLDERRRMEIEVLGGGGGELTLYDGEVRRLDRGMVCGDGLGEGWVLEAGRYYVRVRGTGGGYGLRVGGDSV